MTGTLSAVGSESTSERFTVDRGSVIKKKHASVFEH